MDAWWTNKKDWEKDLSWDNFKKWFSFELDPGPIDLVDNELYQEEL